MEAVAVIPENALVVPQWQIDEVLKRKEHYSSHPEELIDLEDVYGS